MTSPSTSAPIGCALPTSPLGVADPATAEQLVHELEVPVNVGLAPGVTVARMASAGVSRIPVGPTLQRRAMADLRQRARELLASAGPSDVALG